MKLLIALAFLALEAVTLVLGHWLTKASMRVLGTGHSGDLRVYAISVILVSVKFLEVPGVLTGIFSWGLLILLVATTIGQWLIVQLLGAVSGVTIPERQTKIQVLNVIWGMQNQVAGCFLLASAATPRWGSARSGACGSIGPPHLGATRPRWVWHCSCSSFPLS